MIQLSRPSLAIAAMLACACVLESAVARAADAPTVDDVATALEHIERLFFESSSLLLEYSCSESQDLLPSYFGKYASVNWKVGCRGDKWFSEYRFAQPLQSAELYVPAEPTVEVVNRGFIVEWTQYNKRAILDYFGDARNMFSNWQYTRNLSLDAPKYIVASNGKGDRMDEIRKIAHCAAHADRPFLPAFLRANAPHYRVHPEPEVIDGTSAWLVEWPGMDRIWVAPSRNLAPVRRAYAWGPGKPLRQDVRGSDFREVKAQLWLPFVQHVDMYAGPDDSKDVSGKVVCKLEYQVLSIEFDTLSDEFFDVKLPPRNGGA